MVKEDYNYESSVKSMFVGVGWMYVMGCRSDRKVLMFSKAVHEHIAIALSDTVTLSSLSKMFKHISSSTEEYRNYITPETTEGRNPLDI